MTYIYRFNCSSVQSLVQIKSGTCRFCRLFRSDREIFSQNS